MPKTKVRVRYAPSPTGYPHVGNIRTALFNWLFARHHKGVFILRIEDTDQSRTVDDGLPAIFESLDWLGLDWDEGPVRDDPSRSLGDFGPYVQSKRLDRYQSAADSLIEAGHAYECYCTPEELAADRQQQRKDKLPPKYVKRCRNLTNLIRADKRQGGRFVTRFAVPEDGDTSFTDAVRGPIVFRNDTIDDFVMIKSDGFPTYHLASVVDDCQMEITHVLRGDEWISSTPKHVLLYEALDWEQPTFAHLPVILGPDRAKLSKRHGAASLLDFKRGGYLPDAMVNFLVLLGWSLDDKTEIFDRRTLVESFDLNRVIANPAVWNIDKLDWMNGVYIRNLAPEDLAERARPFLESHLGRPIDAEKLAQIAPLIQERIKTLTDVVEMADFFFTDGPLDYEPAALLGKKSFAGKGQRAAEALASVIAAVEALDGWTHEALESAVRPLAEEMGVKAGELFAVIRVAVTGKTAAPPLFETMAVLARDLSLERLSAARDRLA